MTTPADIFPRIEPILSLQAAIRGAPALSDLVRHAAHVRAELDALMAADAGPAWATRCLSKLNDEVVSRILALLQARFRLPPTRWCWLAMGSEGREEQTLATDQDNGLLFSAGDDGEAQALRDLFLPFAQAVNQALAECGFPLCSGGVMAGNPKWCLSGSEWRDAFANWIRTPEPEALLNASIFFDFRPLAGDMELARELRRFLGDIGRGNDIFLRMMAANALAAQPPLGWLRDFDSPEPGGRIDLKKYGARIFVDAARILALGAAVDRAGTVDRLRGAAQAGAIGAAAANAACEAFHALQGIRLSAQLQSSSPDNFVAPDNLNEFQRRVLLDAFRQARALQRLLSARFRLDS